MRVTPIIAVLALSLLTHGAFAEGDSSGWRKIYEEEGISVSTREEAGRDMPSLRGQAELKAPILHLLAILLDDEHSKEWAKGADETKVLRKLDPHTEIIYARSRQPWPVKDRDLVMQRTVEVLKPGEWYRVHLVCLPGERPQVPNVVRMERCETTFLLRAIDATRTQIDYRVHADPGGHFPDWIVRLASKSIPLDTLSALARRAERTRGQYREATAQWAKDN
jgi:hypothetical protein